MSTLTLLPSIWMLRAHLVLTKSLRVLGSITSFSAVCTCSSEIDMVKLLETASSETGNFKRYLFQRIQFICGLCYNCSLALAAGAGCARLGRLVCIATVRPPGHAKSWSL